MGLLRMMVVMITDLAGEGYIGNSMALSGKGEKAKRQKKLRTVKVIFRSRASRLIRADSS